MTLSEYVLKLTGKVSLPEQLEVAQNYHVAIDGSVTAVTTADNQDGTFTAYYKFEPVKVDMLNPLGKTIKGKDTRSMSKKLRAKIWLKWESSNSGQEFEEYYEKEMTEIIRSI